MKELLTRTLTGAIFALLILGSILWSPWAFFALMAIFSVIGLYEFIQLFQPGQPVGSSLIYYFLGLAVYVLTSLSGMFVIDISNVFLIVLSFSIIIAVELFRYPKPSWHHIGGLLTGIIYVAIPFGIMNGFFFMKSGVLAFPWVLLALFILVWANDVFAYLIGSTLGKHKLFERISPKKTWEGSIGGLVFTLFFAWVFSYFAPDLSLIGWLFLGIIISVSANLGDLAESLLKRNAGVKDSGRLFPGHGGVLDRFDALLFATPFVFFYLFLI